MSGGFQIFPEICNGSSQGTTGLASEGVQLTSGAGAGVYGSWTQIVASSSNDTVLVGLVTEHNNAAADYALNVDIGVGAGGSEVVIASGLSSFSASYGGSNWLIPLSIPAGTRISARSKSASSGDALFAYLWLFDGAFQSEGVAGIECVAFQASQSVGPVVTPGVSGAKGSYTQIIASTARDYVGVCVFPTGAAGTTNLGAVPAERYLIDVAIGSGGSEVIIIPDFKRASPGSTSGYMDPSDIYYTPIPAGTRIAARASSSQGTAQNIGLAVYGLYA